jgi:hypothetical protein
MAKEFEGLREVIRDISGDVERMSSDEKLIKELEQYIKEDPLAFLGWQMYKANLIDMKVSEQKPGENLIRFNDGRKIELGGIYSPKGAKVIPVRTGFEKSENVAVFDENAPSLGSVIYAKGAREENLERVTILHELRHVASRHLKNKYADEYFDEETNHKIEEDQQRILDLYTLISTGDYKDGDIGFRGAAAFADSKDFGVSLFLAQKNARLALKELDSLNVSVPDKMKNSVNKMKTVFEFELGEKDQKAIQLVRESFERVKLKEENGDANMMELNSRDSKFFEILEPFEAPGRDRSATSTDGLHTRGSYHVTLTNAYNLSKVYPDSEAARIYNEFSEANKGMGKTARMKAWGDTMYENPEFEQIVAQQLIDDNNKVFKNRGIDLEHLTDEEYNGLHLYSWNVGAAAGKDMQEQGFARLTKLRKFAANNPSHQNINQINDNIDKLKKASCGQMYRPIGTVSDGHVRRDANARSLCFDGRQLGLDIDPVDADRKGQRHKNDSDALLREFNQIEGEVNYMMESALPPKPVAAPPARPLEPAQMPPPPKPPEPPKGIAPRMVTGVTEQPEEVIGLEAPIAPSLVQGDMR